MTETPDPNTGPIWGSPAAQAPEADMTPTPAPFEQVSTAAGPNVTPTQADNPRGVGRLAGVAIVAAFALVAVTAVGALALSRQSGDTGSSAGAAVVANTSNNSAQTLAGLNGSKNQALCESLLKNMATQFTGGDTAKLQAGFVAAANATIDDAVKAGTLTVDQGKAMKDRLANLPSNACAMVPMMGRGWMGGEWGGEQPNPNATPNPNAAPNPNGPSTGAPRIRGLAPFGLFRGGAVLDAVAKSLNITSDQLRTELGQLKAGEGVCTLATNHKVSCDTVKTAAHDALKTQLDAAVTAGRVTQQQEDQALKALDTWLTSGGTLPQFRMGPGMGGGMFPGFRGGPGSSPNAGSDQNGQTQTQ